MNLIDITEQLFDRVMEENVKEKLMEEVFAISDSLQRHQADLETLCNNLTPDIYKMVRSSIMNRHNLKDTTEFPQLITDKVEPQTPKKPPSDYPDQRMLNDPSNKMTTEPIVSAKETLMLDSRPRNLNGTDQFASKAPFETNIDSVKKLKSDDSVGFGSLEQQIGLNRQPNQRPGGQNGVFDAFGGNREAQSVENEIKQNFMKDKHIIEHPFSNSKPNPNDSLDFRSELDMIPDEREPLVQPPKRNPAAQRGSEPVTVPQLKELAQYKQKSSLRITQPSL